MKTISKSPKGSILIIGGAEDKGDEFRPDIKNQNKMFEQFEILKEVLPKNGSSKKTIEVISTASSLPDEMNQAYKKAFGKIGFKDVGFIKIESKEEARDPKFAERIEKSHAVFFTGGDQFALSATVGGTPIVHCIREKLYKDKNFVVAGTSAGAMAMTKIMIFHGSVQEALLQGDLKMSSGLGIFDTCIIDTHFIKRGRFGRLANAVVMNPESLGVGLGEDTALLIRKGEEAECVGSGTIIIIDGNDIGQTNITDADNETPIFVEGLKVHVLTKGCRFLLKERKMARPAIRRGRKRAA